MKRIIRSLFVFSAVLLSTGLRAGAPTNVDEHLLKMFANAYPAAEKITWTEANGHFVVHFLDHKVRAVMEYDADARVVQSIRYYSDPSLLPQNISWEFYRQFPEKNLYGITEISNGENTAWFLKCQDARQWVTVRATSDGRLQITERLKKQL